MHGQCQQDRDADGHHAKGCEAVPAPAGQGISPGQFRRQLPVPDEDKSGNLVRYLVDHLLAVCAWVQRQPHLIGSAQVADRQATGIVPVIGQVHQEERTLVRVEKLLREERPPVERYAEALDRIREVLDEFRDERYHEARRDVQSLYVDALITQAGAFCSTRFLDAASDCVGRAKDLCDREFVPAWQEGFTTGQRGVHLPPGPFPIPAIGGPGFGLGQQIRVKLGNLAVPVQFVGLVSHFPTLYPDQGPFILVNLADYRDYARSLPISNLGRPNEMWLSLDPSADRQRVIDQIPDQIPGLISIRDRELAAELAGRNPLAGGGWDGLTAFSMVAIGIAVLLTLTVHALVSIRMGRMDLAVARVLGFSRRQFFLSLATERLIVAVLAIAAGAAMGYWPGLEILELVDLTPQGDDPVPPLMPSIQGWLMAGVLSGLLAASVLSVGFAAVAARRLNPAEVLRGGG